MTRLQVLLKISIILLILIAVAIWAFWQRGILEIVTAPEISFCVVIDNDPSCFSTQGNFTEKIKKGSHHIIIKREGYLDWQKEIQIDRGERTRLMPEFIFAPAVIQEKKRDFYHIPEELVSSDFRDDQWLTLEEACGGQMKKPEEPILIDGLPSSVTQLSWHPNGKWAIGQTKDEWRSQFFIYDVESGKVRKLDSRVHHAIPFPDTSDDFLYLWQEISGEGKLIIASRITGESEEITDLPRISDGIFYPSLNGDWVLFQNITAESSDDFYLIDRHTGRRDKISFGNNAVAARWAPDSQRILLVQQNDEQEISFSIWDLEKSESIDLSLESEISKIAWLPNSQQLLFIDQKTETLSLLDLSTMEISEVADLGDFSLDAQASCASEKEFLVLQKDGMILKVRFAE